MNKEKIILLRGKVKFYAESGMKKSAIALRLGVSRPFVDKWFDSVEPAKDGRGWKKGKKRKFSDGQERQVIQKRKELEGGFFLARNR